MPQKSLNEIKQKIEKQLSMNLAQLRQGLLCFLKMNQSPKDSILEFLNQPGIKVSKAEQLLRHICPHTQYKRSDDSKVCSDCGEYDDGWWCDKSPDNSCYYFSEEKEGLHIIELKNGSEVVLPANHDPENESDDWCVFCGEPEERK